MIGRVGGPGGRVLSRLPTNRIAYSKTSARPAADTRTERGSGIVDVPIFKEMTDQFAASVKRNKGHSCS